MATMTLATLGVMPPERVAAGFTLHRSETVAHSAGLLDRKNSAASSRARGRSEGFACKHSENFKPLGAPVPPERVFEMHNSILAKVAKIEAAVSSNANSQHQDKKDRDREKRLEHHNFQMLKYKEVMDKERATSPDAKDAVKDEQAGAEEASLEADREEMLSLSRLPHALYGKDLPRCGQVQERQEKDGFKHLKLHIKDSFRRVEQVKSDADAAFEARKENMQLMLQTPRHTRPASPCEEPSSAFLTSVDLPHSAREKRQAKRRPSKQVSLKRGVNWLPSLAEYLADPGATVLLDRPERGDVVKQTDHGKHKDIIKEIVAQLIPLAKGPRPNYGNVLDEGKVGAGKGRWLSRRKLLEKDLNDSWKDKAFYKRCTPFIPQRDAEEYRRIYHNDEHKLATIERFLKDLGFTEELKDPKAQTSMEVAAGLATSLGDGLPATGGAVPADPYPVLPDKRRGDDDDGGKGLQRNNEQPRAQDPVVPLARARFKAIRQKAMAQLREPEDPSSSSLAILRAAVYDYQAEREKARQKLQDALETQEKSRMASAEKLPPLRLNDSRPGAAMDEPADNRQHHWYHSLLEQVRAQGDLSSVSKAMHSLLDSVKAALDDTGEFTADDFWETLTEIQSEDFTPAVASLLASMIRGINGLNTPDLQRVLQQRDVASEVLDVLSGS